MEAFYQNIDALERKTEDLVQKWRALSRENQLLQERNGKLEKEIKAKDSKPKNTGEATTTPIEPTIKRDFSHLENLVNTYIEKIDTCIDLINKELNG